MDSTLRFSDRVTEYVRFRPSYPLDVIDLLRRECGLREGTPVADVGSGTGIFAQLLQQARAEVFAVEPNEPMRKAAESLLGVDPSFHSLAGTAEATGLPDGSVELVTCAQSFHWFNAERAVEEFRRILRSPKWLALVWNERETGSSEFMKEYDLILWEDCPEYQLANHREFDDTRLASVWPAGALRRATLPNSQTFDEEGFIGRVMSSSYAPKGGHEQHEAFMDKLRRLFEMHQTTGRVEFVYRTELYYGALH